MAIFLGEQRVALLLVHWVAHVDLSDVICRICEIENLLLQLLLAGSSLWLLLLLPLLIIFSNFMAIKWLKMVACIVFKSNVIVNFVGWHTLSSIAFKFVSNCLHDAGFDGRLLHGTHITPIVSSFFAAVVHRLDLLHIFKQLLTVVRCKKISVLRTALIVVAFHSFSLSSSVRMATATLTAFGLRNFLI